MKSIIKLLKNPEVVKLIKFCLVGGVNTGISMLVFVALVKYCHLTPELASLISYCAGLLNSYLLNKFWTFRSGERTSGTLIAKFIVVNLIALAINLLVIALCFRIFQINEYISQLIALVFSTLVNFIGNRRFVFKKSNQ
ncbi:MAG: GtrA family protein [Victivallaceae bacterium]